MGVGVVSPTIPVANDIILGEFKAYANYGLPEQVLLGVTRSGCKVAIDRQVKEVSFDGAYGHQLDSNGVPLVRYEKLMASLTLEQLYLKSFNKKNICSCESDDTFVSKGWDNSAGGTYTDESSLFVEGTQSAKLTGNTSTYGIHKVFASAKNLTVFDNNEASSTSDYIGFCIYISTQDKTDLNTAKLRIGFHKDVEGTITNQYYFDINASDLTANMWNSFEVAKSSFTQAGTASWSAVTGVSLIIQGTPSAEVIAYIDDVSLIQSTLKSAVVPVNGGGFDYTDETTYIKYTGNLEITDQDYYENVTLIGQRHDGKMIKIILEKCLNDGAISLALQEKDEVVNSTQFTAHYNRSNGLNCPIKIREYI